MTKAELKKLVNSAPFDPYASPTDTIVNALIIAGVVKVEPEHTEGSKRAADFVNLRGDNRLVFAFGPASYLCSGSNAIEPIRQYAAMHIDAAIADEREACAKAIEASSPGTSNREYFATLIRQRNTTKE